MSKNPQKTDFIDLDEKEFKKKKINFKYFLIVVLIALTIALVIFFRKDLIKNISFKENTVGGIVEEKLNIDPSNSNLSEQLKFLHSRDDKIVLRIESLQEIEDEIKSTNDEVELLSLNYKKVLDDINSLKELNETSNILTKDSLNLDHRFLSFTILNILQDKITHGNEFLTLFKQAKNIFSNNSEYIKTFEEIEKLKLFSKLNSINILNTFDYEIGDNSIMSVTHSDNNEHLEIKTVDDLKKYVGQVLSSLFVVRKIENTTLSDSTEFLMDKINIKKKLMTAKNYYLTGEIDKSLKEVQSINEPTPNRVKDLEIYLLELRKVKNLLEKLKTNILND